MSKKALLEVRLSGSTALVNPKAKSSRVLGYHSLELSKKSVGALRPLKYLASTQPPSLMSPVCPEPLPKQAIFPVTKKPFSQDFASKSSQNSAKGLKSFRCTQASLGSLETAKKPKPKILVNSKSISNYKAMNQKLVKIQHGSSKSLPQQPMGIGSLVRTENRNFLNPVLPSVSARTSVQKKKTCVSAKVIDESSEFSYALNHSSESDDSDTNAPGLSSLAESICESLLGNSIRDCLKTITSEAQNEVISAYLSLFSSKILFKVIEEALDSCTPKIVQLAYIEESEAEYTGIRDQVFAEFYEQQVHSLVDDFNLTQISLEIMKDYAKLLPIPEIVKECISEEAEWKFDTINGIYEELIDNVMDKETTELLIEDEIGKIKIEEIWKSFPKNLLKDFKEIKKRGILDRLAEFVWFDYLNEDLGCEWVKELVDEVLEELWKDEDGGKTIGGSNED